jgi:hypothetical protein
MIIDIATTIDGHRNWNNAAGELRGESYKLGQDAAGFDLWRHGDGRTARIRWIGIAGDELGRFIIERLPAPSRDFDRISELVKRRRDLLEDLGFARAEKIPAIAAELEATAAELEQLSAPKHAPELEAPAPAPIDALELGAILYSSWGYDQTNVDFYRVAKRTADWVTLEKIAKIEHSDDTEENPATFTGRVVPADPIKPIGEPLRRKIIHAGKPKEAGDAIARLTSYSYAYLWDGKPKRVSSYA